MNKPNDPQPISLEDLAEVTGGAHQRVAKKPPRGAGYGRGWTNGNQ